HPGARVPGPGVPGPAPGHEGQRRALAGDFRVRQPRAGRRGAHERRVDRGQPGAFRDNGRMSTKADRIRDALGALSPTHLEVLDESHMHSRGLETHYKAIVVS